MVPSIRDVLIVEDDEYFAELYKGTLDDAAYNVSVANTVEEALAKAKTGNYDLIILDVRMPHGETLSSLETHSGFHTGIALARKIRRLQPEAFIVGLTASDDQEVIDWFTSHDRTAYLSKWKTHARTFVRDIGKIVSLGKMPPQAFIVHGRDLDAAIELKNYLQNVLHLPEPTILAEKPAKGKTIIEKFEEYAENADLVFVLFTPDDVGRLAGSRNAARSRARQNVIFEIGYFVGRLKRQSGRVILLHKGPLELPSDLAGVLYISIEQGIKASGEDIRREIADYL